MLEIQNEEVTLDGRKEKSQKKGYKEIYKESYKEKKTLVCILQGQSILKIDCP